MRKGDPKSEKEGSKELERGIQRARKRDPKSEKERYKEGVKRQRVRYDNKFR